MCGRVQAFPGRPAPSDAFRAAAAGADTANATTAEELVLALTQGRRHIVITQHLDLTNLKPLNFEKEVAERQPKILGNVPDATRSITVRLHSVPGSYYLVSSSYIHHLTAQAPRGMPHPPYCNTSRSECHYHHLPQLELRPAFQL